MHTTMKTVFRQIAFALALCFALGSIASVSAQDTEEAIKGRLLERVKDIDALKLSGKVGENNVGLLEQRDMLNPAETTLMNAENSDRRALYTILAKRLGLTTTVVGQGRSEELRKKSAPGVWLQDRNGEWYKNG